MSFAECLYSYRKHLKPEKGLSDELFYFTSSITPMINVDLLIQNNKGQTLLSWRDHQYSGKGWHIPGGIIRFREIIAERIKQVALTEIGEMVEYDIKPLTLIEVIDREEYIRGHFISLLYRCRLPYGFIPKNERMGEHDAGYLKWFDGCPDDLLSSQEIYRKYITGEC
jgi:ADP-ribose pyrophosphatase YjhB (NUDIX family)